MCLVCRLQNISLLAHFDLAHRDTAGIASVKITAFILLFDVSDILVILPVSVIAR